MASAVMLLQSTSLFGAGQPARGGGREGPERECGEGCGRGLEGRGLEGIANERGCGTCGRAGLWEGRTTE